MHVCAVSRMTCPLMLEYRGPWFQSQTRCGYLCMLILLVLSYVDVAALCGDGPPSKLSYRVRISKINKCAKKGCKLVIIIKIAIRI
jgi:hypothetical protein